MVPRPKHLGWLTRPRLSTLAPERSSLREWGPRASPGYIWLSDPADDTHVTGPAFPAAIGYAPDLVDFPPDDCLFALQTDGQVWRFVLGRGALARSAITALNMTGQRRAGSGRCGFAYDNVSRRIGGNVADGIYYAFDPAALTWSATSMNVEAGSKGNPDQVVHCLDFDTERGCFVLLGEPGTAATWIFRPVATTPQARSTRSDTKGGSREVT